MYYFQFFVSSLEKSGMMNITFFCLVFNFTALIGLFLMKSGNQRWEYKKKLDVCTPFRTVVILSFSVAFALSLPICTIIWSVLRH